MARRREREAEREWREVSCMKEVSDGEKGRGGGRTRRSLMTEYKLEDW